MSIYFGRGGVLRIYESTEVFPALADASVFTEVGGVATDDSTDARADDAALTVFWGGAGASLFMGRTTPFARFKVDLDVLASADTGALVAKYYNGSTMAALTVTDGTAVSGNTMRQDGYIYFDAPGDWVIGADAFQAGLNADEYYISLEPTVIPATAPEADVIWPVDGLYYEVPFVQMDLNAPEGRPRPEEVLELNREVIDTYAHYTVQTEAPITEAVEISFSAKLDSTYNKTALSEALNCGNPGVAATWNATGVSTKTDTKVLDIDGNLITTPAFVDASKKTVAILIVWNAGSATTKIGRAWHEVYFNPEGQTLGESGEGVTISCVGQCFGAIDDIQQFGYKY